MARKQLPSTSSYDTLRTTLRSLERQLQAERRVAAELEAKIETPQTMNDGEEVIGQLVDIGITVVLSESQWMCADTFITRPDDKSAPKGQQVGVTDYDAKQLAVKIEVLQDRYA